MTDRRVQLRLWLLALDRFELSLRVKAARARNAFLREAAESYAANHGHVPGWLAERHRRRLAAELAEHYARVIPHFAGVALRQIKSRPVQRKQADQRTNTPAARAARRNAPRQTAQPAPAAPGGKADTQDTRTGTVGVEIGEKGILGFLQHDGGVEACAEALGERGLACADRPFDRDVAERQGGADDIIAR